MSRVSISAKSARRLLDLLQMAGNAMDMHVVAELCAVLSPKPKSSARKKTETKRRKKGAETKLIRGAVMARAGGRCENCNLPESRAPLELDHQWGRGRIRQESHNCWALCRSCHRAKTDNNPSRVAWLEAFRLHASRCGYREEAAKARRYIEAEQALEAAESVGCP